MRLERDPAAPRHGYTRLAQEMPMRAHGSANGYTSWGCRCGKCRDAWRVYSAARKAYLATLRSVASSRGGLR
jgi:hypothetical protein